MRHAHHAGVGVGLGRCLREPVWAWPEQQPDGAVRAATGYVDAIRGATTGHAAARTATRTASTRTATRAAT